MTHTSVFRTRDRRKVDRQLTFNDTFVPRLNAASVSQPDAFPSFHSVGYASADNTEFQSLLAQVSPAQNGDASPTSNRPRLITAFGCTSIIGCILILALAFMFLDYLSFKRNLKPAITVVPPPVLLNPQEFAQSGRDLAQAVADLNAAEYRFLQTASAATPAMVNLNTTDYVYFQIAQTDDTADNLGGDLQEIAARAMSVSVIASNLGNTAASQDGASDAAMQLASQYFAISRYGAALVIEAQNIREGLVSGVMTNAQASAVIAEYSARLWYPVSAESESTGNPFTQFLNNSSTIPQVQFIPTEQLTSQLGGSLDLWMAASPDMVTVNLTIPDSTTPLVDFHQADTIAKMTTTDGQADAKTARQLAASIIRAGGNTNILDDEPDGGGVTAAFSSAVAVASPNNTPSRTIPAFPNGTANVMLIKSPDDIVSTIIGLGPDNTPTILSQTPIKETTPVITLTISNLVVKQVNQRPKDTFNTFDADVNYEFDVQWQANLTNPQFELDCVSGNHFKITTVSGTQHISAKGLLILFPGAEDAYCYASRNGNTLGSASVNFLVGDPTAATQRAIQVETDTVSLNITLTADALGTLSTDLENAAATKASIGTENALSTEVVGTQNAEFLATVTEIARQTQVAVPVVTETPLPTPTFVPVLVESLYLRGDQAAISTSKVIQRGHLYRFCFSGIVYLTTGGVEAYELMHVNGIAVPVSGCLALEGTGAVAIITCGHGTSAEDPGGYSIDVYDLGPW
jgi:hypothetical protein